MSRATSVIMVSLVILSVKYWCMARISVGVEMHSSSANLSKCRAARKVSGHFLQIVYSSLPRDNEIKHIF
jgi:hypothetical protein